MKPCIDCGMIPPNHHTGCPGWTDADYAAVEEREFQRRLREEPWTLLRECAEAVLIAGPAARASDRLRLRRALKETEGMGEP